MDINEQIKQARKGSGISRAALGAMVGVKRLSVFRWENGVTDPGREMVKRLAEALRVRLCWRCPHCGADHQLGGEE